MTEIRVLLSLLLLAALIAAIPLWAAFAALSQFKAQRRGSLPPQERSHS